MIITKNALAGLLLAVCLMYTLVWGFGEMESIQTSGWVQGKQYDPPRTEVRTTTNTDGNVVYSIHNISAKYTLMVKFGDDIESIRVSRDFYYEKEIDNRIQFTENNSRLFSWKTINK